MRRMLGIDPGWGLFIVRLGMAVILIPAGYAKWFQFGVTTGVTAAFTKYGLPIPMVFAVGAGLIEFVGGILLLIGLFARWVGLLVFCEFTVAAFYVRWRLQGYMDARLEMLMLCCGLLMFLAGPGRAAIDRRD
ncbi:MAG TPA: DoxX family protein [Methylomirabilota bacterium]|nr:DoxX family protein [Methylomirabilota bacterium]